jgi:hypothetical protein
MILGTQAISTCACKIGYDKEVAYLTSPLEKTKLSEKIIEEDLSRVEESATKSTYNWVFILRDVRIKVKRVLPSLFLAQIITEEEALKPTKTHYPSNPKPSFNPKIEARKETPMPREEAFICMFCGRAGHLDEFCFHRKKIEKMRLDYARNSYRDEFIDFLPRSYSRAPSHFFHGHNHQSYGIGL